MYETATSETMRRAFDAAHRERAEAFAGVIRALTYPFHALPATIWPQGGARRREIPPQACPAGQ